MAWHMITASELTGLSVPERLFEYAEAYRNASDVLCSKIATDPKSYGWPDAAVVLMLAAHSVELFLKGALLRGFPNEDIGDYGHRLEDLSRAYRERFTESIFEWDIPFGGGEYPPGLTENCRTKKERSRTKHSVSVSHRESGK